MTCRITIPALRLYCHHGVGEQERRVGNWFTFAVTLDYDATLAVATDDVAHALSYAEVIDTVREQAAIPSRLLEHLAGRIRRALTDRFPQILSGTVAVTKLHAPVGLPIPATITLTW